jgi:hypothetical protein
VIAVVQIVLFMILNVTLIMYLSGVLFQSTQLLSVLPSLPCNYDDVNMCEVMRVLTPEDTVSALHSLVTIPFSESASVGKSIVSGVNWMQRVSQSSLTTCVLKGYFLDPAAINREYSDNLFKVFQACEGRGLRLCGLRTAYVTATGTAGSSSKKSSSRNNGGSSSGISGCINSRSGSISNSRSDGSSSSSSRSDGSKFIHGSILSQPLSAASREDCHLVLVACFYTPR